MDDKMGKRTWILRVTASAGVCLLLLAGCTTPNRDSGTEDRDRYIDFCRELATSPMPEREDPDDFMSKPDWMVHPCSTTDQEFKKEYNVVYADRQYLSFRCSEYAYTGGAHGNTQITVGTIDRKTGKILTLADVPAFADRHALKRRLQDDVVMKIGKDALQGGDIRVLCFLRARKHRTASGWQPQEIQVRKGDMRTLPGD